MPDQLRKLILLVEDNPDDEILTLDALHSGGVKSQIDVARDGAEALDYVFRRGQFVRRDDAPPDLILLDLKMPRLSGGEFRRAQLGDPTVANVPVAVMSGATDAEQHGRALGAVATVTKPIDVDRLLAVVRQFCA